MIQGDRRVVTLIYFRRACLFGALLLAFSTHRADAITGDTAVYTLGLPQITGDLASYPVSLEFGTDLDEVMGFFGIDVSVSDAALTENGTDFSNFSFEIDLSIFSDWEQIPGSDFGDTAQESVVEYESLLNLLTPDTYEVGTLTVDFSGTGIEPGAIGAVTFAAVDSVIGVEVPGNSASFRFVDADFEAVVVPEPSGICLLFFGIVFGIGSFRHLSIA